MNLIKKIIAVILFVIGSFFICVAFNLFKSSIGAAIVALVFAAGLLVYPALKIRDYVREQKTNGQTWKAVPAVAVSVPLFFGCLGLAMPATTKEEKASVVTSETSIFETTVTESEEETTVTTVTPTPVPTNTPTPEPTPTPIPTEETTEATTTAAPTKETTKATTKSTTAATTVATEAQAETAAPPTTVATPPVETTPQETAPKETVATQGTPAETQAATEAPAAVVAPATEATTVKVVSEARDYVLNTRSGIFHETNCSSVKKMSDKNREDRHCSREELINAGYDPCGNCHP